MICSTPKYVWNNVIFGEIEVTAPKNRFGSVVLRPQGFYCEDPYDRN